MKTPFAPANEAANLIITQMLTVITCDLLKGFPIDGAPTTIIANIYAELVDELLTSLRVQRSSTNGKLILSGISHQKVDGVRNRLKEKEFTIYAEEHEEWWHAISTLSR